MLTSKEGYGVVVYDVCMFPVHPVQHNQNLACILPHKRFGSTIVQSFYLRG